VESGDSSIVSRATKKRFFLMLKRVRDLALELDETLAVRFSSSKQLRQALCDHLLGPVVQVIARYAQPQLFDFGEPALIQLPLPMQDARVCILDAERVVVWNEKETQLWNLETLQVLVYEDVPHPGAPFLDDSGLETSPSHSLVATFEQCALHWRDGQCWVQGLSQASDLLATPHPVHHLALSEHVLVIADPGIWSLHCRDLQWRLLLEVPRSRPAHMGQCGSWLFAYTDCRLSLRHVLGTETFRYTLAESIFAIATCSADIVMYCTAGMAYTINMSSLELRKLDSPWHTCPPGTTWFVLNSWAFGSLSQSNELTVWSWQNGILVRHDATLPLQSWHHRAAHFGRCVFHGADTIQFLV
jgi:hypothetical protein